MQEKVHFLGHQVQMGKYDMESMLDKLDNSLPIIEGRKTLQRALGFLNTLKPHVQGYA